MVAGVPRQHQLPSFFMERCMAPLHVLASPNLGLNRQASRVSLRATAWQGMAGFRHFWAAAAALGNLVDELRPDVILNLYEPLVALLAWRRGRKRLPPIVQISHQALFLHESFKLPLGRALERMLVLGYTRWVMGCARKSLALSWDERPPDVRKRIVPVPPLLRQEVAQRTATAGQHVLVYMVYPGVADRVHALHAEQPQVPIHAFWSRTDVPDTLAETPNLTFHRLNDQLFLDLLASARGVCTTAGFETVAEALYYGKPALLMPMPGQYEQYLNAHDAQHVGAGMAVTALSWQALSQIEAQASEASVRFRQWLEQGQALLLWHLQHPTELHPPV